MRYDLIVVGTGPAGFMTAIMAGRAGLKVLLCDKLSKFGAKILVSGGGKCNLTNLLTKEEFINSFQNSHKFVRPIIEQFYNTELISFLGSIGVQTSSYDNLHIFPKDNKASSVVNALIKEAKQHKVKLLASTTISSLLINESAITGVKLSTGEEIFANQVAICTGGKSYPKCGGGEIGYNLAKQAGHKVTKLLPAMAGIKFKEDWIKECAGITLEDIEFYIDEKRYKSNLKVGSIVFTHSGISGLRVLDISGNVAELLQQKNEVTVRFSFIKSQQVDDAIIQFNKLKKNKSKVELQNFLSYFLPKKVARLLSQELNIVGKKINLINESEFRAILTILNDYPLTAIATEGFDRAMVTRGGIKLKDINSETLESKLIKGLFFAGEVLNIDGPCGGFNIQWAFSCGYLAGSSIAKKVTKQ